MELLAISLGVILVATLATIAYYLRALALAAARGNAAEQKAVREVVSEMGVEFAQECVEAGLYHPTYADTKDSFIDRQRNLHKETFDPTEGWGEESIFDLAEPLEAGRYSGK